MRRISFHLCFRKNKTTPKH